MTRTIETNGRTRAGTLQEAEIISTSAREKVVWLTDEQLEANWVRDEEGTAEAAGGLVVPGQLVYTGGNGGDEAYIPPQVVRGYN